MGGTGQAGRSLSPSRRRLDAELVRRGLATSRERARHDIAAGRVTVAGAPADKPGRLVAVGDPVAVAGPAPRFVSRGGEKLEAALRHFRVEVEGRTALDAGASTGGFTDCLLQRGARRVTAVDVGRGQFHERLRGDPRVRLLERTNVRHLTSADVDAPPDLVVADLSFISLATVAPALVALASPDADLVLLVKPQFEAGRVAAARGRGVVTDPALWRAAVERVRTTYEGLGAAMMGVMVSPLLGPAGNAEFLVHLVRGGAGTRLESTQVGPVGPNRSASGACSEARDAAGLEDALAGAAALVDRRGRT